MVACPWPLRALGRVLLVGGLLLVTPARWTVGPAQGGTQSPVRVTPAPRAEIQLRVLYSGCREVRSGVDGLECVLEPDAELTLWVGVDPGLGAVLTLDGVPVGGLPEAVDGGLRWQIHPDGAARRIDVHADLDGVSGRFGMKLATKPRPRVAELDRINALPKQKLRVARRELDALLPELTGEALALGLKLAGERADSDGDIDGTIDAYARGVDAAYSVGWWREASTMAQRIAYVCLGLRYDDDCARKWLERDARLVAHDPEQQLYHAYYQGLRAERVGDLRAALRVYREQEQQARALGFDRLEAGSIAQQLSLSGRLGAHDRTQALRRRAEMLEGTLESPRERSQLINAIAWMLLDARGRGLASEDPVPLLRRALALVDERSGVIERSQRQTVLLNLAYAAVLEGHARTARRWLDRVEGAELDHLDRSWWQLLRARIAGLEGDPETAQRRFIALLAAADRLHEPELRWHALVGHGEILEALGQPVLAQTRYVEAEALLETQLPRIALGGGRERFMAERNRSARRLVDLMLRRGDRESALCAARLARTRTLRTLTWQLRNAARDPAVLDELQRRSQERARIEAAHDASWELPAGAARAAQRELEREREINDEALDRVLAKLDPGPSTRVCELLPKVDSGELHLHYMQLDDGWVGFAVDERDIAVERLGPLSLEGAAEREAWPRLGRALLRPFAAQIGRAQRIRIMTTGELTGVPFQALPVEGEHTAMLLDLAEVRYGLDRPLGTPSAATRETRADEAIVVAPPSNLPYAEAEAREARAALGEAGWRVRVLEGDAARGGAVREALAQVDLLHYVGHARSEGQSGWDSTLSLARGDTLGVEDVLALPRAPGTVVLDGCETGLSDPETLAGGMSLAYAFVLAGSQAVIATPDEVDDATAAALMEVLYEALASGEAANVDQALRAAQRGEPDEDWLEVRSFGP
jgi:CHAT domain